MRFLTSRLSVLLCVAPLALAPAAVAAQEVQLDVSGGSDGLRQTLQAASLTLSLEESGGGAAQDFVAAARADYRRLLTGLYSEGYYGGTISIIVDGTEASQLDPLIPRNTVSRVVLSVNPGPRFTFGRADVAPLAPGTTLPEAFATGETARASVIGDAASAAVNGWRAVGRPLAATTDQTITARHSDQQLDAVVTVAPGPELTFGTINVEGNDAVRSERVLAIAGIPAQVYDPALIDRAEENLRRTGAFASATVLEGDAPDGTTLPLTISVVEQTPRRIGAGAEFSSVSGLTLSGYWLHRNLLGGAERFRV
ncbi:MAG: outer membrane protein assembly factor, partial [Octadecabacter sp.]|nr:outer membrane protein assembly factor [Octadecabacter sp.]